MTQVPIVLDSDATFQVLPAATMSVDVSLQVNGHRLEKMGAGQLLLNNALDLGGGTLAIEAGLRRPASENLPAAGFGWLDGDIVFG